MHPSNPLLKHFQLKQRFQNFHDNLTSRLELAGSANSEVTNLLAKYSTFDIQVVL